MGGRAMVRRQFWLRSQAWLRGVNLYRRRSLWHQVWHQGSRGRWGSKTLAIVFWWLLGLLGGAFVVLQLSPAHPSLRGWLQMATWLQALVGAAPEAPGSSLSPWLLAVVGLGTWLCWLAGSRSLTQLVASTYQSHYPPPGGWPHRLVPWAVTGSLLVMVAIAVGLVTAPPPGQWTWVVAMGRWIAAVGVLGIGIGLVHRLSAAPWPPATPLLPGLMPTVMGWLVVQGLCRWLMAYLSTTLDYGLLLGLGVGMVGLHSLIWLVPLGAQVNVLVRFQGPGSGTSRRRVPPPPPSFDSFKINR
jgi:hypothetical protein